VTRPALIGERGSVSLLALAAVGLSVVLCLGIARVGGAAVLQARADTAADAAALAGADALALGRGPSSALRSARAAASLMSVSRISGAGKKTRRRAPGLTLRSGWRSKNRRSV